ncbi:MAG: HAD-IC family P-type ATPase [Pyrinomonadaceae bacterium]|nr:HAD-IC family P-type ATPase [Pyrinomonadaceae bacterium]
MAKKIISQKTLDFELKTAPNLVGLSWREVETRAAQGLQNVASTTDSKRVETIVTENLLSVFNFIVALIISVMAIFYIRSGDERLPLDAIGVLMIAVINTSLAVYQEIRAKDALDKVNLLLKRNVFVVREGKRAEIDQSEIVVGDLICIERGDQITVDGVIEQTNHLEIDESLLTGEALPIEKAVGETVLSGSFCVAGNGFYTAEKVGLESYAAKINESARHLKLHLTPLQRQLSLIIKALFAVSLILVVLEIFFGSNGSLTEVDLVRKVSTLVIALVPHGLVLMSSITFALGVYRISQLGAIVQRLNAIESFANVKVVCMDKTGTLTQNKLTIKRVTMLDEDFSQPQIERWLGIYGELSTDKNATLRTLEAFAPRLAEVLREGGNVKLLGEIPFSSDAKMSLIEIELDDEPTIFVFGAFDILLNKIAVRGMRGKSERLFNLNNLDIYRNLMFARVISNATLEELRKDGNLLQIEPLAVVSIADEVRTDAFEAIKLFQRYGIALKILSGDAPESVKAVATEIGWKIPDDKIVSGSQLDAMNEADFINAAREKAIFARLNPDHKLKLIKALRDAKIYTVMIGDGVNDLPAIKEADLGIAMEQGSSITREVADIVLLNNKFALLPRIFDEGNRIINTVNSTAKLFLSKNFLVIYLALLAMFLGWTFPLTPRRVSLLNIFTIALPSFIIALRNRDTTRTKHFVLDLFSFVILSGALICTAGFVGEFYAENYLSATEDETQMVMLTAMTFASIANFFAVAFRNKTSWTMVYVWYGLGIIGVYSFLVTTRAETFPLNYLKIFYEITYLDSRFWSLVAIISFSSGIILFLTQKLRELFIKK